MEEKNKYRYLMTDVFDDVITPTSLPSELKGVITFECFLNISKECKNPSNKSILFSYCFVVISFMVISLIYNTYGGNYTITMSLLFIPLFIFTLILLVYIMYRKGILEEKIKIVNEKLPYGLIVEQSSEWRRGTSTTIRKPIYLNYENLILNNYQQYQSSSPGLPNSISSNGYIKL